MATVHQPEEEKLNLLIATVKIAYTLKYPFLYCVSMMTHIFQKKDSPNVVKTRKQICKSTIEQTVEK